MARGRYVPPAADSNTTRRHANPPPPPQPDSKYQCAVRNGQAQSGPEPAPPGEHGVVTTKGWDVLGQWSIDGMEGFMDTKQNMRQMPNAPPPGAGLSLPEARPNTPGASGDRAHDEESLCSHPKPPDKPLAWHRQGTLQHPSATRQQWHTGMSARSVRTGPKEEQPN